MQASQSTDTGNTRHPSLPVSMRREDLDALNAYFGPT